MELTTDTDVIRRYKSLYRMMCQALIWSCLLFVGCEPPADDADATQSPSTPTDAAREPTPEPEALLCTTGVCACSSETPCTMTCNGFCEASCGASTECLLNCPQGSCRLACTSGRTCTLNCPAGGCTLTCPPGAQCSSVCPGGACPCSGSGCS